MSRVKYIIGRVAVAYCFVAAFGMLTTEGFGMRIVACVGVVMYALMKS
jgi:hypothetical protein